MSLLVALMFSLEWLKMAGAQGQIADVTSRLGGAKIEIDYPGRGPRESKLQLLKIEEIKNCLPPKDIRPGDIILIFNASGGVVYSGTVTENAHLKHIDGRTSARSVAAYCARYRKAAGVKVLRKPWWKYNYTKRECMVPMRDGTCLYTAVYEPVGLKNRPILLQRSPYPCCPFGTGGPADIRDEHGLYAQDGYIIVYQNVRGTYLSEGEFVDLRPLISEEVGEGRAQSDEATDTFDTIEWLIANTSNNGNVGVLGVSYNGFYATLASVCGHPALKAVSPQAPVTDWWKGDDAHHNGVLTLSDMYGFGGSFFLPKLNPTPDSRESINIIPEGTSVYNFFKGKSLGEIWDSFGNALPFMLDIKSHPDYDSFWQERNPLNAVKNKYCAQMAASGTGFALNAEATARAEEEMKAEQEAEEKAEGEATRVTHATAKIEAGMQAKPEPREPNAGAKAFPQIMVVGGVYDAEDAWGAVETYKAYKDVGAPCRFVYGPWTHGGWRKVDYYLQNIEYPFFAYYLDGKGSPHAWQELYLPSGIDGAGPLSEGGAKKLWANVIEQSANLGEVDGLAKQGIVDSSANVVDVVKQNSEGRPADVTIIANHGEKANPAQSTDTASLIAIADPKASAELSFPLPSGTYTSDPSNPVPYMESDASWRDKAYMWAPQNFASQRPDVLSFIVQGPLTENLLVIGPVKVHIRAKVEGGTDADFVVKLIDVSPDGTQNLVRGDVFPARYRVTFNKAQALEDGKEFDLDFNLVDICHCFNPGHSIMVQVQSSCFPLFAMNPQSFLANPYSAKIQDYKTVQITILNGSSITLNKL